MDFKKKIIFFDDRRDICIPGNHEATLEFCVNYFIRLANKAIEAKGAFFVALSGGSTPKRIFERLADPKRARLIDWTKVFLFWSDERSVPPNSSDSNFRMAMQSAFGSLPIPTKQIHRMHAEYEIKENALAYENLIKKTVPNSIFDLVTLGMGDDGHTASLFPHTDALHVKNRLVIENFVTQKNTWRMSFTYDCINQANNIALFVLGPGKKKTIQKVLKSDYQPDNFPSQRVGTLSNKALWILDKDAAEGWK